MQRYLTAARDLATRLVLTAVFAPLRGLAWLWRVALEQIPYSARRRYVNPERNQKAFMLQRVAQAYALPHFVETGTHTGDTTDDMRKVCRAVTTIELDDALFAAAQKRFAGDPRVRCVHGDSGEQLHRLTPTIDEPALFWLDGHYSGENTAGAGDMFPLGNEIAAIAKSPAALRHAIVIDDMSDFTRDQGNEPLSEILAALEQLNPAFRFYFDFDMLFALPGESEHRGFWRTIAPASYVR